MKLGKLPARPDAIHFKFGMYFDRASLPTPPRRFGHYRLITDWGVLGNDDYSDCVWAGGAHETMMWHAEAGSTVEFTDQNVLSDYSADTGFISTDPNTDQGSDMQEAASYRRKTGIVDAVGNRHKIDSYIAIAPADADELALATYLFGAVGVGLEFPRSAMNQFNAGQPWDVTPSPSQADGGHYIPCVGRNSAGNFLVVTWGRLHAMTPDFYEKFCDEAVAYVSTDALNNNLLSPEGYNLDLLRQDLSLLKKG
jgi:hypothetical protein